MVEIEQWELRITARQGNARSPEAQELDLITCYLQLSKLMQPWQAVTKKQNKKTKILMRSLPWGHSNSPHMSDV